MEWGRGALYNFRIKFQPFSGLCSWVVTFTNVSSPVGETRRLKGGRPGPGEIKLCAFRQPLVWRVLRACFRMFLFPTPTGDMKLFFCWLSMVRTW